MNEQLGVVGNQIKQHSELLAEKVSELLNQDIAPSLLLSSKDQEINWLELFFESLGDSLCSCPDAAFRNILRCTGIFGQRAIDSEISPDKSLYFFIYSRTVISDFLFEKINGNQLTANTVLSASRTINQLIDSASISFISHYKESLSAAKYALAESNEGLHITLKELNDLKTALDETTIFSITDKNDNITYINDKFCEITKYSKEELIGQNHGKILNSGYHPKHYFEDVRKTIQQGRVWKGKIMNKTKEGTTYWVDTTIIPFLDSNGNTYQHIAIQNDITEQQRTEELLRKTEKLSLVGELAAGIAHEIRNPLTTIRGFVQLLSQSNENKDLQYTETILDEIDRINFIVSEFMVFAKPHAMYYTKCNLSEVLSSIIHLLRAEAMLKNVKISQSFSSDKLYIFGEEHQLKQVFLNMLKNAIEALPDGGNVHVSATSDKNYVTISIEDNGIGIPPEQIPKLGEPFYTTKETGNGLGLMVSFKIIDNHNGNMTVKSDVNSGTTFLITFPLYKENKVSN
ncbi:ATP-binding protein [Bacillus sp. V59.32b]|uniref:ATP-binding protein n=1 Tax=Bacillus sp. V59.32b TaxID=1758642 RepID=UPI00135CF0A5|nr:ATP-binding protein [Bacillus sp. V59.32b]